MTLLNNHSLSRWYAPLVIVTGLFGIMFLHLVPVYLAGLLVFFAVRKTASLMPKRWYPRLASWLAFLILLAVTLFVIRTLYLGGVKYIHNAIANRALMNTLDLGWDRFLSNLSPATVQYLPPSFESLIDNFTDLIGAHWATVGALSHSIFHGVVLSIVGIAVGVLIALEPKHTYVGVFDTLAKEVERVARGFWGVLSSQFVISLINTSLTCIYLFVMLPKADVHLPYPVFLVMVTFVAGLLPVLGNLISNTVIVLMSFTVSALVAVSSLVFLILIHKLEYFLNAKIIAMNIHAKPWELLMALVVGDAAFGLSGLMVAPFFYGYYKLLIKENVRSP